jgi:hypothetical protein
VVRRTFSAAYKLETLAEYEAATDASAKGALLRREGLYSSRIVEWRRAPGRRRHRRSRPEAQIMLSTSSASPCSIAAFRAVRR